MYKEDLTLNNLQWLICHKSKQNKDYSSYDAKLNLTVII